MQKRYKKIWLWGSLTVDPWIIHPNYLNNICGITVPKGKVDDDILNNIWQVWKWSFNLLKQNLKFLRRWDFFMEICIFTKEVNGLMHMKRIRIVPSRSSRFEWASLRKCIRRTNWWQTWDAHFTVHRILCKEDLLSKDDLWVIFPMQCR